MPSAFQQVAELDEAWETAKEKVLARVARMNNPHRPLMPYIIIPDISVIAVYHGNLDKSWWMRGGDSGERDVQKVESVIRSATGLRRVASVHARSWVVFRIRKAVFQQAAVAVRLSFDQDETYVNHGTKTVTNYLSRKSGARTPVIKDF